MRIIIGLVLLVITTNINYAQYPDTIRVKTERIKGYGPFNRAISYIQTMQKDNPWTKATPEIKDVPDDLEYTMFGTEQTDFLQYTYQSYYSNKVEEELFNSCMNSWNWHPLSSEYTKKSVKVNIAIVAGYDSSGLLKIKVDKNNNYDFSDDKYFTLPKKIPGQRYFGRYNDLLPFKVNYEYYDGKSIKKTQTWLYLDYSMTMYNSKEKEPHPVVLAITFAEYHKGEFYVNGNKYIAAVKSDRAIFRENYTIKVWNGDNYPKNSNFNPGISRNGFVKIDDYYYRFDKVSTDGKIITLVKDQSVLKKGGNQVGFKAINFVGRSLRGKVLELKKLKGNYVLLDFWGTWCAPCRAELPQLKSLYAEYKSKNFVMIGIANDDNETLNKFITKNKINWEQIAQSNDKTIISNYGVIGYPTTFLIDTTGVIIAKNIRVSQLSKKLSELFNK